MTFKEQIRPWWTNQLGQLEAIKSAHEDGAIVRFENGDDETSLTDEQSKALLSDIVQLIDVILDRDFPVFTDDQGDIAAAMAVHDWHEEVYFDLLDKVDEMGTDSFAASAEEILSDLLKLPFSLNGK